MKRKTAKPKKALKPAKAPVGGLKSLFSLIGNEDMTGMSSLYLDPIDNGFKVSLWTGKKGVVEGFLPERTMPPFVRRALVRRTESMMPGESIEVIGKREEDIALIASEPIDARANGSLIADISDKDGEVHLKITLMMEQEKPLTPEEAPTPEQLNANIERLSIIVNRELGKNSKVAEYEREALKLMKEIEVYRKLEKHPKDRKSIEKVYKASSSLSELSKKVGFSRIHQLADCLSVLFKAYHEKGASDPAAAPIVRQTVQMMAKMMESLSGGQDVDSLVRKISRKD